MNVTIIRLVNTAFEIYSWLMLARILLSWFPVDPYNPAVRFIARVTDPFLRIFRGLIPPIGGMLDISPILAFFALRLIQTFVVRILWQVIRF